MIASNACRDVTGWVRMGAVFPDTKALIVGQKDGKKELKLEKESYEQSKIL